MHRRLASAVVLPLAVAACGISLSQLFEEHPPHPREMFTQTSDAWVDSAGGIRGSFVGEGTSRAVHLVSTDTALIADLARRYRPDLGRQGNLWSSLSRAGTVTLDPTLILQPAGRYRPVVGSPEGHTDVQLTGVLLRGSSCGWRGAQAELVVSGPRPGSGTPALRGPVVGSFRLSSEVDDRQVRTPLRFPANPMVDTLLAWTRMAMDSMLAGAGPGSDLPLRRLPLQFYPVNSLLDIDAADLVPFRAGNDRTRYAVSLRERRLTARGDTVLATIVMVWDSTGTWQQTVLGPTLLTLRQGRLAARRGWTPVFWRRLQAVSGFEYRRDYIWMEQVAPADGSILWGIMDPHGNVPVAAAEMAGPCTAES